jgi:hypothetical protein
LILRVLMTNFLAMHTTSMVRTCFRMSILLTHFFVQAFTQALYCLAANPEFAVALRKEVNAVVREYGWTKAAIDRMYRIDSFLRESQRLNPVGSSEFNSVAIGRNFQLMSMLCDNQSRRCASLSRTSPSPMACTSLRVRTPASRCTRRTTRRPSTLIHSLLIPIASSRVSKVTARRVRLRRKADLDHSSWLQLVQIIFRGDWADTLGASVGFSCCACGGVILIS